LLYLAIIPRRPPLPTYKPPHDLIQVCNSLTNLERITSLELSSNQLTGTLPVAMGPLGVREPRQARISLFGTHLFRFVGWSFAVCRVGCLLAPPLSSNPPSARLSQPCCPLSQLLPGLTELRNLGMGSNNLTGSIPQSFAYLNLQYFRSGS